MAPMDNEKNQLFLGLFIHSIKLGELQYLHDAAVCVDKSGKIVAVESQCDQKKAEETLYPRLGWVTGNVNVTKAKDGQFFFPGFIGMFMNPFSIETQVCLLFLLTRNRHTHPCAAISQRWCIW